MDEGEIRAIEEVNRILKVTVSKHGLVVLARPKKELAFTGVSRPWYGKPETTTVTLTKDVRIFLCDTISWLSARELAMAIEDKDFRYDRETIAHSVILLPKKGKLRTANQVEKHLLRLHEGFTYSPGLRPIWSSLVGEPYHGHMECVTLEHREVTNLVPELAAMDAVNKFCRVTADSGKLSSPVGYPVPSEESIGVYVTIEGD